ncbi:MAG: NAD(P)/FAD-dependent oxidoreductase [Gemmatimonadota bacterium]
MTTRPRVIIVGGGFGGIWAARELARQALAVTLLDRNPYHTFYPLLYQVAAAELGPTSIAHPIRSILRGTGVDFRLGTLLSIEPAARRIHTDTGTLGYEYLVLALGSVAHFFGVQGAAEHAFPLRTMPDAIRLRAHILDCFEHASRSADAALRRRLLTFTIVGGGPTGVEYAGALAELALGALHPDYPQIPRREPKIVLLEAADRLLGAMPPRLSRYADERLRDRGVDVRFGAVVDRVSADQVRLRSGTEISTATVVWTAGVAGDPAAGAWGLPVARGGRISVGPSLQVSDHPEILVVGDLAWFEQDGTVLPQVAQTAMQQGAHAGRTILRLERGQPPEPFRYRDLGMMAVIGRNAAVADLGGRAFTGFVAWLLWLVVHLLKLIGFRNRALVLLNWGWNYLTFPRSVRLVLPGAEPRRDAD